MQKTAESPFLAVESCLVLIQGWIAKEPTGMEKDCKIPAKEYFIASFEAVIQSAVVLTANNRSILVLLSVLLASWRASAAQIFGQLKAVL